MGNVQLGPDALRLQPLHLAMTVPAASTVTVAKRIQQDATLTALRIRIYSGPQMSLQLRPYIINARGQRRELIAYGDPTTGAKQFVDGDDDTLLFPLSEPVDADSDERVCVDAVNLDPVNPYDFSVSLSVDYSNGQFPGVNGRG